MAVAAAVVVVSD